MDSETITYFRGLEDGLNKARELITLRGEDSVALIDLLIGELRKERTEDLWQQLWENGGVNPGNIMLIGVEQ
ncbi:MAG: hypothetical protein ACP5OC_08075 [Thermoplasmata archaeon]